MGLDWDTIREGNHARLRAEGKEPVEILEAPAAKPSPRPRKAPSSQRGVSVPSRGRPGVPTPKARKYADWVYEDIRRLYVECGWRIGTIGLALGLDRSTVAHHVKFIGEYNPGRSRGGPMSRDELLDVARYWVSRGMLDGVPELRNPAVG